MPNEADSGEVKINRARLGSIDVYEITESELELLERGSPNSTILNFAIGLLSVSISFFVSLLTTTISDIKVYVVFWVVALVTLIVGLVLLILWWQSNTKVASVVKKVRKRMPPTSPPADSASNGASQSI